MEKTSKETASETLAETLQRLTVQSGPMYTFPVSLFCSKKLAQVLFLEAGKDFVDTLLSFLLLPVGTIIHMLSTGHGEFPNPPPLSIEKLRFCNKYIFITFICNFIDEKSSLHMALQQKLVFSKRSFMVQFRASLRVPVRSSRKKLVLPKQFYRCLNHCNRLSSKKGARCYTCWPENGPYKYNINFLDGPYYLSAKDVQRQDDLVAEQEPVEEYNRATGPGFVKENITFMVTDKLEIMASATIEIMSLLKEMKVNSLADL